MTNNENTVPDVVDCGHAPQPTYYAAGTVVTIGGERVTLDGSEVMFPGYATMPDGRRLCPDCADDSQREEMKTADRFSAYVSSDDQRVTTWTGGKLGTITRIHRNDRQTFVSVTDTNGGYWTGIGPAESGTYVSLRRIKTKG